MQINNLFFYINIYLFSIIILNISFLKQLIFEFIYLYLYLYINNIFYF
jgi:hypothetical protein